MSKKILSAICVLLICLSLFGCGDSVKGLSQIAKEDYLSTFALENQTYEVVLASDSFRYYVFTCESDGYSAKIRYCVEADLWNPETENATSAAEDLCDTVRYSKETKQLTLHNGDNDNAVLKEAADLTLAEFKQFCWDRYQDTPMEKQEDFLYELVKESVQSRGTIGKGTARYSVRYSVKLEKLISAGSAYETFCRARCTAEQWNYLCEQARYQIQCGHESLGFTVLTDTEMKTVYADIQARDFGVTYFDLDVES